MQRSSLKRAQHLSGASTQLRVILFVGACSAVLVPLLVIDLGLILQLLVGSEQGELPRDWVLGALIPGRILEGPLSGDRATCLVVLVGVSWLLALMEAASIILLQRLVHRYALQVCDALRQAIHDQAFVLGPHDLLGTSRSRPEELFTERCESVRCGLAMWLLAIPRSVVELSLLLAVALAVNFWLTLLALLLTVYILRFYRSLRGWRETKSRACREEAEKRLAVLLRELRLAPLATGYSLENPPGERFQEGLEDHREAAFCEHTNVALLTPILLLVVLLALSFVLLVVGVSAGVTVAATVLLATALFSAYFPALRLYRLRDGLQTAESAAGEVLAYLDREPSVIQVEDAQPLDRLTKEIRLDTVTIANREGQRLLDQVSLKFPAGRVTSVVSSDHQTPMALAGLFVRFYDPAAGRILFDDRDICRATLETVRGQAVLVAADGPIFPTSIDENIACGNTGFTALQIKDAIKQARADEFIQALPQGPSTVVDGKAESLSGDQAFRVGLARALLREPSLLIVQEPAGEFDDATSQQLNEALQQAAAGRTVVMLPSRLATLRSAEMIYLFHEGKLHAEGTHTDLLQTCELYRHLNYLRFNAFRHKVKC